MTRKALAATDGDAWGDGIPARSKRKTPGDTRDAGGTGVSVENRQRIQSVDRNRCEALLAWLVRKALPIRRRRRAPPWREVMLILVSDRGSAEADLAVFGDPSPTDVITLSYGTNPGEEPGLSGELIVNVQRAVEEGSRHTAGRRRSWDADHELALYLAHGIDHLTGADDADEPGYARMRRRELRWVAEAEQEGRLRLLAGKTGSLPVRNGRDARSPSCAAAAPGVS